MNKSLLLLLLTCSSLFVKAQDKIPSFGKIDKADLEMKDCDFDPGAEAVVLFNTSEVYYFFGVNGVQIETSYRIRIKVLKEKGIKEADIKFPYFSKRRYDDIHHIEAVSYNLDENGKIISSELEKKQVYDKQIDESRSEISFAVPNVKVGTVFEYKYKKTRKSFSNISPWMFQKSIPVKYSEFNLQVPEGFDFSYQTIKRQEMELKKGKNNFDGTTFIMRNVPGLKSEAFASSKNDYYQRVDFTLRGLRIAGQPYFDIMGTWDKAITELLEDDDFGGQLKKNIKNTPGLEEAVAKASSTKEKINAIYKYVQQQMEWNGNEEFWSVNGIKNAWDKKSGSVADINLLLVNLLKENGITAKPALASSKENGMVNTFYPNMNQFDRVLALAMDGEDAYAMNACDKNLPFYLIHPEVLYTSALVIDKEKTGWIELTNNQKLQHVISLSITPDANGKLAGDATISSNGYGRKNRLAIYKSGGIKSFLEDNAGIKIKVDSVGIKNGEDDSKSFEQEIKFTGNMESSGEYMFLPYNLFSGLIKNPFVEENRVMDIDFGYPQSYTITGNYFIPDGFVVEELPPNTKMIMPDTSITVRRITQQNESVIQFRLTVDFVSYGYKAEDYEYVKEFFKKMYELLDDRVVLKKKK